MTKTTELLFGTACGGFVGQLLGGPATAVLVGAPMAALGSMSMITWIHAVAPLVGLVGGFLLVRGAQQRQAAAGVQRH